MIFTVFLLVTCVCGELQLTSEQLRAFNELTKILELNMQGLTMIFPTSLHILFEAEEASSNMLSLFKDVGTLRRLRHGRVLLLKTFIINSAVICASFIIIIC